MFLLVVCLIIIILLFNISKKELGKYFFQLFIKNIAPRVYDEGYGLPNDYLNGRGILTVQR